MLFFGFRQLLEIHTIAILKEKPTKQSCLHLRHKIYAKYVCKNHTQSGLDNTLYINYSGRFGKKKSNGNH